MILVDTNILIDFWKNPTIEKQLIFEQEEIATCGVIFTEILRGSKNPKESEKLKTALPPWRRFPKNGLESVQLSEALLLV